jgi:fructose-1-phosphate kinase PfkB-like protein
VDASIAIFEKIRTDTSLTIVTDGPNIACGVSNKEVVTVQPEVIRGSTSRLGAGDAFFAYFLSYKELNPSANLKKSLYAANKKTQIYLKAND